MIDINTVISNNIIALLKEQNRKQSDLANILDVDIQTINDILNGTDIINAHTLQSIADYLDVEINVLTKIDPDYTDSDIVRMFHKKSRSKYAFQIADNLSDMILFHKKVRENNEKYNSEFM